MTLTGGGLMVTDKDAVADPDALSFTRTLKLLEPAVVGVPDPRWQERPLAANGYRARVDGLPLFRLPSLAAVRDRLRSLRCAVYLARLAFRSNVGVSFQSADTPNWGFLGTAS